MTVFCGGAGLKIESSGLYDNYTVDGKESKDDATLREVKPGGSEGPTEFLYKKGFLFPAIMWLNFSIKLNENKTLPVGSGQVNGVFVVFPMCTTDVHFTYPADETTFVAGLVATNSIFIFCRKFPHGNMEEQDPS